MNPREQLLARVRSALGRRPGDPVAAAPEVDPDLVHVAGTEGDLAAVFAERAEAVGMTVHRYGDAAEAAAGAEALLRERGARRLVASVRGSAGDEAGAAGVVLEHLLAAGFERVAEGGGTLEAQYEADAGLTDVAAAIAESGSLALASDAAHGRGASLVPPVHLAVVEAGQVVGDMLAFWDRYAGAAPAALPSSVSLVTGPSKTADIEGELITGVHGPGEVHILIVERS